MISTLATATTANEQHGTQAQTAHALVDAVACSRARRLAPATSRTVSATTAGAALVVIPATRVSTIATTGAWTDVTVDGMTTLGHNAGFAINHVSSFAAEWIGGYPTMAKKDHSQRERPT